MPPKSSPKKRSTVGSLPDAEEFVLVLILVNFFTDLSSSPSQRNIHPVKRKLLRPKSPSPIPETDFDESDLDDVAESVVDNDAESGDQDESGGLEAADDSMGEFIDDTSLFDTDGEEEPPVGYVYRRLFIRIDH